MTEKTSRNDKIDPWGSMKIEDYSKVVKQFGISSFLDVIKKVPQPHKFMLRNIIYGHRDFGRVADAMASGKKFVMLTGLMPSGKFHFGHKMIADQIIYYQKMGAEVYICVADIEAYTTRGLSMKEIEKLAIEEYLLNYIALGIKPDKCHFYFQSKENAKYQTLSKMISKHVTFNELKAIYGGDSLTPSKIMSALTQVADILYPQMEQGRCPTVVPVGTDQDPHIRLTRDIASRFKEFKFLPPSSTYNKFMSGLQGGKMSSSKIESYIALTDTPADARKKVMRALTGGRETLEEQKKKGGQPHKCAIYELYTYHLMDDDGELKNVYDDCVAGKLMCGDDKKHCADLIAKFLEKHHDKRERARKDVGKFIKD
ncbi:MAG: tryptophan--tRNA ligase [Candidatus Aenigmarchaeota archaeon]|nr:tryptophan--tRNA ligase [Candidatus Aenigmarchaeota archaeon]